MEYRRGHCGKVNKKRLTMAVSKVMYGHLVMEGRVTCCVWLLVKKINDGDNTLYTLLQKYVAEIYFFLQKFIKCNFLVLGLLYLSGCPFFPNT